MATSMINMDHRLEYRDFNITNDDGINVTAASNYSIDLSNIVCAVVLEGSNYGAVIWTYATYAYVNLINPRTMAAAPAGNYKIRVWYQI